MRRKVVGVGLSDGGARNGIERALYARQGKHHMLTQSKRIWPGCLTSELDGHNKDCQWFGKGKMRQSCRGELVGDAAAGEIN